MGALKRGLRWISGARDEESGRVVLCFLALLFLLISYYLIKPLRNSQFLKEFDPDFLPFVYFGVVMLSLIVTKIFNYLADRMDKYRLITWTFIVIMALKLVFAWLLIGGGKIVVVAFYFFASVYFLLAIATIWACNNDIFTPDQGERCFGFIAIGSTLGSIVGSHLSGLLSKSEWRDYAPVASVICMAIALVLLRTAAQRRRSERGLERQNPSFESKVSSATKSDLKQLLGRPYVRRIGVMVMVLATFNTSLDFVSNRAIDEGVSQTQYQRNFSYLPAESYRDIYELKKLSPEQREAKLTTMARQYTQPPTRLVESYEHYRSDSEVQTRALFSDVYLYQGLLGIFLLLVVARLVFHYLGMRYATIILPILAGIGVIAFSFQPGLSIVELIMVIVGSTNYSLNNAAKEILFTASDEETKFKFKPLIEGPGMRTGDMLAVVLTLTLTHLAAHFQWPDQTAHNIFLIPLMGLVLVWLIAAYKAGREYDLKRQDDDIAPADQSAP